MKIQIIYIIPQELFESTEFTKNDLKVYGRIHMLPYGLTTTQAKFAEMIELPLRSVKRSISKLTKHGWLLQHNGALKTLMHGSMPQNHGVTVGTNSDKDDAEMVSQLAPDGVTVGTNHGVTVGTTHNIYNIKSNINKKSASASAEPPPSDPDLIYMKVCDDPDEPRSEHICMTEAQAYKLRDEIFDLELWPDTRPIQALYNLFLAMDVWVSADIKKRKRENYYRTALNWIKREAQRRDERNARKRINA